MLYRMIPFCQIFLSFCCSILVLSSSSSSFRNNHHHHHDSTTSIFFVTAGYVSRHTTVPMKYKQQYQQQQQASKNQKSTTVTTNFSFDNTTPRSLSSSSRIMITRLMMKVGNTNNDNNTDDYDDTTTTTTTSRRTFIQNIQTVGNTVLLSSLVGGQQLAAANAVDAGIGTKEDSAAVGTSVLVLGGTGFVGRQVVQLLQDRGISVISTSRDGRDNTIPFDATIGSSTQQVIDQLRPTLATTKITAIISCIGSISGDSTIDEQINRITGDVAQYVHDNHKEIQRFAYITVAPDVKLLGANIDLLQGYLRGKEYSRSILVNTFDNKHVVLIEPTFIYGGTEFQLNPPRVASFYGQFIESILSSNIVRTIEQPLPSGNFIKIALEPPISVEDVAKAMVVGILQPQSTSTNNNNNNVLDTYDKIKMVAAQLQ